MNFCSKKTVYHKFLHVQIFPLRTDQIKSTPKYKMLDCSILEGLIETKLATSAKFKIHSTKSVSVGSQFYWYFAILPNTCLKYNHVEKIYKIKLHLKCSESGIALVSLVNKFIYIKN